LLLTSIATLGQTCHSGRKEATIFIYGYGSARVRAAHDLFVCVVYVAPIGSKHENESLFQNLVADIVEVQTLGGVVLLGGDFNARTAKLPDTLDTSDLCELLQAPELAKIEQPSVVATQQNRDANVGGWGRELLNLCCDAGLLIFNGRTPGDQ
jgi:hypothetical protein